MPVSYNTSDYWGILTQSHGSSWKKVFPYCIANATWMLLLTVLDRKNICTVFEISNVGHGFLTLTVSFLLVTRVNSALARYNEARSLLGTIYSSSRDIVFHSCIYSSSALQKQNDNDRVWRSEVAYRTLVLLRAVMAVIDYHDTKVLVWDIPELNGYELDYVLNNCIMIDALPLSSTSMVSQLETKITTTTNPAQSYRNERKPQKRLYDVTKYRHRRRSAADENFRVPIHLAYLLKKTIHSQATQLSNEMSTLVENRIMSDVDSFMTGYNGISKFLQTPVPFPLIQMTRTIVLFYTSTIPFVMLSEKTYGLFYHCLAIFIITYGMVGLEMVAIELDDPYGYDSNDFHNDAMAEKVYEDIYLTILDADGPTWTDPLRERMHNHSIQDKPTTELSSLIN